MTGTERGRVGSPSNTITFAMSSIGLFDKWECRQLWKIGHRSWGDTGTCRWTSSSRPEPSRTPTNANANDFRNKGILIDTTIVDPHAATLRTCVSATPPAARTATVAQPLPPLWIWLLRLKGMTAAQRAGFAAGRVELGAAVEAEAWATIRKTLSDHREWYLARQPDARAAEARDAPGSRAVQELSAVVAKVAIEVTTAALAQLPPGP